MNISKKPPALQREILAHGNIISFFFFFLFFVGHCTVAFLGPDPEKPKNPDYHPDPNTPLIF
jgi:hypothetical protein